MKRDAVGQDGQIGRHDILLGRKPRLLGLQNGQVIHRDFPVDQAPSPSSWTRPLVLRFEYGWGPWPALDMTRTCDWDLHIRLDGGVLVDFQPCFAKILPLRHLLTVRCLAGSNSAIIADLTQARQERRIRPGR